MQKPGLVIMLFFASMTAMPAARSATITVDSMTDGAPAADGSCTIREAILAANNDADSNDCMGIGTYGADVIVFDAPGSITLTGAAGEDSGASGDLDVLGDLMIDSMGSGGVTISGGGVDRVFDVPLGSAVDLTLIGLVIENGAPPALGEIRGGGIRIDDPGASLTLIHTDVEDNSLSGSGFGGALGGGIYSIGDVTLDKSEIIDNTVTNINNGPALGGGIHLSGSASLSIIMSRLAANSVTSVSGVAQGGGANLASNGLATIDRSEIAGNLAESGMSSAFCGGICGVNVGMTLLNSTVSGNTAIADTGGAFAQHGGISAVGNLTANNNTIAFNQTISAGGTAASAGLRVPASGTTNEIANTIIANNSANGSPSDCQGGTNINSLGYNIIQANCGVVTGIGDQFGADPTLDSLADNGGTSALGPNPRTHAPLAGSPAIDAGNPGATSGLPNCEPTDQRGFARPADGGGASLCDIGAHEVNALAPAQPGTLQFTLAGYLVGEGDGNATLTVERINGSDGLVTVDYSTADGTAVSPADYGEAIGTLTIADSVTSQTISIPIVDDQEVEGQESFSVALSNPDGGASIGDPGNATVTIEDDDQFESVPVPALGWWGALMLALGIALIGRRLRFRV